MSGTSLMLHGSAYGNGIYSSPSMYTAKGYGDFIALCIVDPKTVTSNKYDIIVSTKVVIQALLPPAKVMIDLGKFAEHWKKMYQPKQIEICHTNLQPKKMRKINKEHLEIQKEKNIEIESEDSSFFSHWILHIEDKDHFKNIGNKITIQYDFSDDYPFQAPFVRLLKPRLERYTGHITSKGAVCLYELTNQGWSPTYGVFSVIQFLKQVILNGGGELSKTSKNYDEFDTKEIKQSFATVTIKHGWK